MRGIYSVILIWLVGVIAGCSTSKTYSDQVAGVNYDNYKTYAWVSPGTNDTSNDRNNVLDNEITYQNLRAEVDKAMAARGFTIDTKNPDLLLRLRTKFEDRMDIVRSPVYSSYNYYWYPGSPVGAWNPYYYGGYYSAPYVTGYEYDDVYYVEGSVTVDVIDRDQRRLIWKGWSDTDLSSQKDIKYMYRDVEKIFNKFPVDKVEKHN